MGEPGSGTGRAVAITLFAGHYGSGKTNVALNYARRLRRGGDDVVVADLDIVNPYFRTKDSAAALADEGPLSSVTQSCPTLCDPMNLSTTGLPVHHQLPEFTQTHIHRVGDAIQPSHPLSSPSPPAPNPSKHQSLFQ